MSRRPLREIHSPGPKATEARHESATKCRNLLTSCDFCNRLRTHPKEEAPARQLPEDRRHPRRGSALLRRRHHLRECDRFPSRSRVATLVWTGARRLRPPAPARRLAAPSSIVHCAFCIVHCTRRPTSSIASIRSIGSTGRSPGKTAPDSGPSTTGRRDDRLTRRQDRASRRFAKARPDCSSSRLLVVSSSSKAAPSPIVHCALCIVHCAFCIVHCTRRLPAPL